MTRDVSPRSILLSLFQSSKRCNSLLKTQKNLCICIFGKNMLFYRFKRSFLLDFSFRKVRCQILSENKGSLKLNTQPEASLVSITRYLLIYTEANIPILISYQSVSKQLFIVKYIALYRRIKLERILKMISQ